MPSMRLRDAGVPGVRDDRALEAVAFGLPLRSLPVFADITLVSPVHAASHCCMLQAILPRHAGSAACRARILRGNYDRPALRCPNTTGNLHCAAGAFRVTCRSCRQ